MVTDVSIERTETAEPLREERSQKQWRVTLRALWKRKIARAALIYIAIFYLFGIFAPLLARYGYDEQNVVQSAVLKGPSKAHWFGTDRLGRDMYSRIVYAARTTVVITIITGLTGGLILGPVLGLMAGYLGGWVDSVINRVGEAITGLPDLLIIILLAATLKPRWDRWVANYYDLPVIGDSLKAGFASIFLLFLVLSIFGWVGSMRLIRALTLSVKQSDYVLAARAGGARLPRILGQHVVPNISYIIVLGLAGAFGSVALSEIGLSFLGLGVKPPMPSFGTMVLEGFSSRTMEAYPHLLLFPALFAVLLLLSFNLLGDALNDVLNPRYRKL